MRRILPLFLLLAMLPTVASALTAPDVVALSKAGVSEDVLMALIDRDKTIFALDASEIMALIRDGVSERIVLAMLKSGREAPSPQPVVGVTSCGVAEPTIVAVGHGPERPNTYHNLDSLGGFVYPPPAPLVYPVPYLVEVGGAFTRPLPACGNGRRASSGPRKATDTGDCRRSR